jgi:hypothetical protein
MLTNSNELSLSREANSRSPNQEIPRPLRNPRVHYRRDRNPTLYPIVSHMNPVHNFISYFCRIHFNIILLSMTGSSKWSLSSGFSIKICMHFSSLILNCMTRPSHPPWSDSPNNIWRGLQIMKLPSMQCYVAPYLSFPFRSRYFPQHPLLRYSQSAFSS